MKHQTDIAHQDSKELIEEMTLAKLVVWLTIYTDRINRIWEIKKGKVEVGKYTDRHIQETNSTLALLSHELEKRLH